LPKKEFGFVPSAIGLLLSPANLGGSETRDFCSKEMKGFGLNLSPNLYCFLKALLLIPNRRIPPPSSSRVTRQGKGQPKSGLGIPPIINIESTINQKPAIIKSHFDAVNISYLLLFASQDKGSICS
jgi:hypothetical protein